MKRWLLVITLLLGAALVAAQEPDPVQIYRTIKQTSDERAGDVRWIEIWETQAGDDWQWVMVDLQGRPGGIEATCYHAVALGGGAPVYFVDGELVPVDSAATLRQEIENRRLVDQSLLYVEDPENFDGVTAGGTETIAGIPSEGIMLTDQDAANLFLIKPPATSTASLWTAIDGGFVTRYDFVADGSTGDVAHTYDLIPGGQIEPPSEVNMQCFDDGFPLPEEAAPLVTGSLTHGTFTSPETLDDMRKFYQETLTPDWTPADNTPQGGRVFTRELDSGSVCRLGLQFQPNPNGGTVMTARVNPEAITAETFEDLPDDFVSMVTVQSGMPVPLTVVGGIQNALDQLVPALEANGWTVREELTDIRDESALVTLRLGDVDTHIIVDATGPNSTVRVQEREPVCGPTFAVP